MLPKSTTYDIITGENYGPPESGWGDVNTSRSLATVDYGYPNLTMAFEHGNQPGSLPLMPGQFKFRVPNAFQNLDDTLTGYNGMIASKADTVVVNDALALKAQNDLIYRNFGIVKFSFTNQLVFDYLNVLPPAQMATVGHPPAYGYRKTVTIHPFGSYNIRVKGNISCSGTGYVDYCLFARDVSTVGVEGQNLPVDTVTDADRGVCVVSFRQNALTTAGYNAGLTGTRYPFTLDLTFGLETKGVAPDERTSVLLDSTQLTYLNGLTNLSPQLPQLIKPYPVDLSSLNQAQTSMTPSGGIAYSTMAKNSTQQFTLALMTTAAGHSMDLYGFEITKNF